MPKSNVEYWQNKIHAKSSDYSAVCVLDDSFASQGGAFPADKAAFSIIVTGRAPTVGLCGIGHIGLLTRVFLTLLGLLGPRR